MIAMILAQTSSADKGARCGCKSRGDSQGGHSAAIISGQFVGCRSTKKRPLYATTSLSEQKTLAIRGCRAAPHFRDVFESVT
jgi:hypothetical protein